MSQNEVTSEQFSALGTDPTCDVCGQYIKVGERVMQTFTGPVKVINTGANYIKVEGTRIEGELVVEEEHYRLIHVECYLKTH